jgi:hypothetical protein
MDNEELRMKSEELRKNKEIRRLDAEGQMTNDKGERLRLRARSRLEV